MPNLPPSLSPFSHFYRTDPTNSLKLPFSHLLFSSSLLFQVLHEGRVSSFVCKAKIMGELAMQPKLLWSLGRDQYEGRTMHTGHHWINSLKLTPTYQVSHAV